MGTFKDLLGTLKSTFKIGKANLVASGLSAARTITIQDSSHTLVGRNTTDTLENKRITPRVDDSQDSSATPTINVDDFDQVIITALATNITSMTSGLTGTPVLGQKLWITIIPTGTRSIAWGASFESSTIILPVSVTTRTDVGVIWTGSIWRCVGKA